MKLKGDLDSIGVAELFKTLADQRATGVLTVNSPMGEKTLALSHGEIAVVADNLSERMRLGDLLISRGKLTEEQLSAALKAQRLDPRSKLGDILVKQGAASPELIAEAIRFQVEEQIVDLFTWKEAAFEFDSERSIDDVYDPDGNGHDSSVQRISVNTQPLMAEAAKRMDTWKQVQDRIPTPYLCFKITPKGEELVSKAPKNTQAVIKFLKEGRTLETTIKRSCLGRLNVCTIIVKLLDDAWIFPIPANELRFLASEHRFKKRFLDALYIYRRLMDSSQNDAEKQELQKQILDTVDAIHGAALTGDTTEGSEIVSYKEAAERYRRKQRVRKIAFAVFCFSGLFVFVYLLLMNFAPKASLPEDYTRSIRKSDELCALHKYDEAIDIWHQFYKSVPDKSSDSAIAARERESAIIKMQGSYLDTLLNQGGKEMRDKNWDAAEKTYQLVLHEFSKPEERKAAEDGLTQIKEARDAASVADKEKSQMDRRNAALALLKEKQYTAARKKLSEVAEELGGSPLRVEVDAGLKLIQDLEDKSVALRDQARQEINNKQANKAIDTLEKVYKDWTDVAGADEARKLRQELKLKLDKLTEMSKLAKQRESEDNTVAAIEILKQAERDYPDFELSAEVHNRLEVLNQKMAGVDKQLNEAKAALAAGDRAKGMQLYAELLKTQFPYLAVKCEKIPISVKSVPPGATVKFDGKEVGKTPCEVAFPVDGKGTLEVEMAGYAPHVQQVPMLSPESLQGFQWTLRRGALSQVKFNGGIYAPPRLIDGTLVVYHGNTLALLDPLAQQKPREIENLFDAEASTRVKSDGSGETIPVLDKDWWCPRTAPEPLKKGQLLLLLPSRDIVSVDTTALKSEKLLTLPTEPIGRPHLESASLKGGEPIIAVGCGDGKIYFYNLTRREPLTKETAADQRPNSRLATGLITRNERTFISLSAQGYMRCMFAFNGEKVWDLDLSGELAPESALPEGNENLAAFAMKDGRLVVVDINQHSKLLDFTPPSGQETARVTVATDGIYVLSRKGAGMELQKYEREFSSSSARPRLKWGPHQLNAEASLPIALGDKAVFVCTKDGFVTAWDVRTGEKLWEVSTANSGQPSVMSCANNLLYLGFRTGELWVLDGQ